MFSKKEKKTSERLFHLARKADMGAGKAFGIRILAIILAFAVICIFSAITIKINPAQLFSTLFSGVFGTERRIWKFFRDTGLLLIIALAIAPASKMRFWNVGAEGQVLMGGLATVASMFFLGQTLGLPDAVVILVSIVGSILAGMIWAVIPAIFKAFWNTNETLFTLMMNYIAMQIVKFCIHSWVATQSGVMPSIQNGRLPAIFGNQYVLFIIVAMIIAILLFIYLNFSKHGYEISVVGESENTARYIGINTKKVIIRTMLLSGAICGIAGLMMVAGENYTIASDSVNGDGFTGVMIAWIGGNNPITMIFVTLFVIFLRLGGKEVADNYVSGLDAYSSILIGIAILFLIGCEFFIHYSIRFKPSIQEPLDRFNAKVSAFFNKIADFFRNIFNKIKAFFLNLFHKKNKTEASSEQEVK